MGSPERRFGDRYGLCLDLRYRLYVARESLVEGIGATINISNSGVLFAPGMEYPIGVGAELLIQWPVLQDGTTNLQLRVVGDVVRSDHRGTVVRIQRHDFCPVSAMASASSLT